MGKGRIRNDSSPVDVRKGVNDDDMKVCKAVKSGSSIYGNDGSLRIILKHDFLKLLRVGNNVYECDKHSKAFRFYVIEPNEFVLINPIIKSRDVVFDENRFSSVSIPSLRIPNGTKDIGVLEVSNEVPPGVADEDEVSDQHSYFFNVEDEPKIFDKAMKSQDVAF
ncbi:hypothetical protein Tco_1170042 [Tanacetum coccineum]